MSSRKVEYIVGAKDQTAQGFGSVARRMDGLQAKTVALGTAFGHMIAGSIGQLSRFARSGAQFIGGLITAYERQHKAETLLKESLEGRVTHAEHAMRRFGRAASEMQSKTIFGDEQIIEVMAVGVNLGITADRMEDAARAAIGLTTKGIGLEAAMMLIARAAKGSTSALSRYGIVLGAGMTAQEKFEELLRQGAEGFEVLARTTEKSTAMIRQQIAAMQGDIKERIGEAIATGVGFSEVLTAWKDKLAELAEDGSIELWAQRLEAAMATARKAIEFVAGAYGKLKEAQDRVLGERIGAFVRSMAGGPAALPLAMGRDYLTAGGDEAKGKALERRLGADAPQSLTPQVVNPVIEMTVNAGTSAERVIQQQVGQPVQAAMNYGQGRVANATASNQFIQISQGDQPFVSQPESGGGMTFSPEFIAELRAAREQDAANATRMNQHLQDIRSHTRHTADHIQSVGVIGP